MSQIKLEKYSGKKTRHKCPACRKNFQFTRYINLETNEYINDNVGICNRVDKCGYHYSPTGYYADNQIQAPKSKFTKTPNLIELSTTFIDGPIVRASLRKYESNQFCLFLANKFGEDKTIEVINKYKIGSSQKWGGGSTVFWQIDKDKKVRTGKIMKYDLSNGKRMKEPFSHISWVHSELKLKDFNLKQCLFGEHLLQESNSPIAIVESEKTAIICSLYFPQYVWLSTGALHNLKSETFRALPKREIILFPDTSLKGIAFDRWDSVAKQIKVHGHNCIISDLLEKNASNQEKENGVDLADYLLKYELEEFASFNGVIKTERTRLLDDIIERYPAIKRMIDLFGLK